MSLLLAVALLAGAAPVDKELKAVLKGMLKARKSASAALNKIPIADEFEALTPQKKERLLRNLAKQQPVLDDLMARGDALLARPDLPKTRKKAYVSFYVTFFQEDDSPLGRLRDLTDAKLNHMASQSSVLNLRTAAKTSLKVSDWEARLAVTRKELDAMKAAQDKPAPAVYAVPKPKPEAAPATQAGPAPVWRLGMGENSEPALLEISAKQRLGALRAGLAIYYGDKEGEYPETLDALVPNYIQGLPEVKVPSHPKTSKITVVKEPKGDTADAYVTDSGGWLYILAPGTMQGTVLLDCNHKDYKGKVLSGF